MMGGMWGGWEGGMVGGREGVWEAGRECGMQGWSGEHQEDRGILI